MKTLALTFDYEVFLGISGTIENCIHKPVNALLKVLEEENIKGVFFVDVLFLDALIKQGLNSDFEVIKLNLQELVKKGHSVELHIHPHWLDAEYLSDNNQWDLSNDKRYRVSSLNQEEREKVFQDSYTLLENICKEVDPEYKIRAFRAGGLCIQPFNDFRSILKCLKITIESSVAPGLKSSSKSHQYDFSNIQMLEPYLFEKNLDEMSGEGYFSEFPILTYQVSFIDRLIQKVKGVSPCHQVFGDGKANGPKSKEKPSFFDKFKKSTFLYSLDGDYYEDVMIKNLKKSKAEFITFICHPKLLSENSFLTIKKLNNLNWVSFSNLYSKDKELRKVK